MEYNVEFIKIRESHLQQLMDWRMRPDITQYMYTDPHLTLEGQKKWLEKITQDLTRKDFVISVNQTPAGYLNITDIDKVNKRCNWGWFIGDESVKSLQLAVRLEWNLCDYVFYTLGMNKLCNETFVENRFVVHLHKLCGCTQEGILRQHICKNGVYYDVSVGSILAKEWAQKRSACQYEVFPFEDE
ncbi:MAG: UDP-4-amino-4,6-dideoxy-N-acetyl-beta-L-altrosamine N-acetyltransferase [Clostridium sp.]|jgi:UDP-4-amino-4,6-dideoxy-N-acetyl-beta-L-altrosamine N-acetyltransferase|nr:UDP-4-amino-4,6-dideoxy-N-acetyl-beta-L-altrosamine N-acetyltransferase [Clostridium sp.]